MSVRRSVFWAFVGQGVSAGVGFAGSVVITRLLSPYELGLYAVAVATSGLLAVIAASGADALIVREVNLTRQVVATATTLNAILFGLLAVTLLGISFAAGPILGDARAGIVLRILALLPLLNFFAFRPAAMLQREMRFREAALVASVSIIVNNAVAIGCILAGLGYVSPAIGAVSGVAATLLLYLFVNPQELVPSFSLKGIGKMALFGLNMLSVSGVAQFVHHASQIILGRLLGISALGLYSRATMLANFIFYQLYGTATRVTFAQMSKDAREKGEVRTTFLRSFYIITSVMWPLLGGLAILSGPVFSLLYGDRWVAAAMPFSILLVAQMLTLSFGMNWELFVIRDKVGIQSRYELTRSLVGLAIFSAGCLFGMTAAALGRLADAAIGLVLYFPWMGRLSEARQDEILGIYARSATLGVVAVMPSFVLMAATGWAHPGWGLIVASVVLGVLAWAVVLRLLSHPLLDEARLLAATGRGVATRLVRRSR